MADAFGKYVASIAGANNYDKEPDIVFPYTCALRSGLLTEGDIALMEKECCPEVFQKEMLCQ